MKKERSSTDIYKIAELPNFKSFLKEAENEDILFSGPFGSGKTHFLKNIFGKSSDVRSMYNIIHIFPVNYSISSNEDIFNLIKYDILIELSSMPLEIIDSDLEYFNHLLTLQSFLYNDFKPLNFFKDLLLKSTLVSKSPLKLIELLKDQYDKYLKYHKDLNLSEGDRINKAIKDLSSNTFSKEMDPASSLVKRLLNKLKRNKQNVLIIDDLDRIDPEHIFRIINVFSAHRDYQSKTHKFGFDKVVLVCDVNNIESIYKYRYGPGVDFKGYISKFYSTEIYRYDIRSYLGRAIDDVMQNLTFTLDREIDLQDYKSYENYDFRNPESRKGNTVYTLFKYLLNFLIDHNKLTIRDISELRKLRLKEYLFKKSTSSYNSMNYPLLVVADYIDQIIGHRGALLKTIKEMNNNGIRLSFENHPSQYPDSFNILIKLLESMLTIIILPMEAKDNVYTIDLNKSKNAIRDVHIGDNKLKIIYKTVYSKVYSSYEVKIDKSDPDNKLLVFYSFNDMLEKSLQKHYDRLNKSN